jgi:uncharacterized protein with NAD-binding domain and iron-sulfur cluster
MMATAGLLLISLAVSMTFPIGSNQACSRTRVPSTKHTVTNVWSKQKDTRIAQSLQDAPENDSIPPVGKRAGTLESDASLTTTNPSTTVEAVQPTPNSRDSSSSKRRVVAIVGAGWGGLSAAHALRDNDQTVDVTLFEASGRVGGLVRDGYSSRSGQRPAEAGQHGFWRNYHNIYHLLHTSHWCNVSTALTDYAEQGQYSKRGGLQAVWPVYRDQPIPLPTGLAQAVYTRFAQLPLADLYSAWPLAVALADFDDSDDAWERYDTVSFRDLCQRLGVSQRCYQEALEPMILTGLFAPGAQCSAAAALGMAYFFVLQSQTAFDVQWCRGNIGTVIFDPWVQSLTQAGVQIQCDTRVSGFRLDESSGASRISHLICTDRSGQDTTMPVDDVIFAVGAKALNSFVRFCPELAKFPEFRAFANLRGTSVLAARLYLDRYVKVPYSANACWGFDAGVGMTMFDIGALHGPDSPTMTSSSGSVLEVDYYHASSLLVQSDADLVTKVKADLDCILGPDCVAANVIDAAIVRLPDAVNWYFPGSYKDMPQVKSESIANVYFAGDIVRTRHGSWSQEKAFVTGVQAANQLLGRPLNHGVLPMSSDEVHVQLGRAIVSTFQKLLAFKGIPRGFPFIADFYR